MSRPAIALPHAGQSYNPTLESHDSLLSRVGAEAVTREEKRLRQEAFKKQWLEGGKAAKQDEDDAKMVRGMLVVDGDDDAESSEEALEGADAKKIKKDPKRKTRVQLNRAKRSRHQVRAAGCRCDYVIAGHDCEAYATPCARRQLQETLRLAAKAAKIQRAQLSSLPSLKKAALEAEAARVASRLAKLSSHQSKLSESGLAGQRLGKFKVPQTRAEDDVQLGEELSENLRSLRPEGNLFKDRFESLTVRGLIEPRMKVVADGRHKRGGKGKKTYEAHSYKRFVSAPNFFAAPPSLLADRAPAPARRFWRAIAGLSVQS